MSEFVLDETERIHGGAIGLRVLSIALVVIEGPEGSRGLRVRVEGGKARIGTAEGSTLRLTDRAVSRIHCELEVREDVVTLRDLGSTNGTFVSDVRIRDADVRVGAAVRCGGTTFVIEAVKEPTFLAISDREELGGLVGKSFEMRRVYAVLERVAASGSTLLVQGETGTGKDVAARAVHAASPRASGPFVPVDCGAIPENLFESELFGHVRGAFTGALANRVGAFEEAHGGTLFLDEIGEMPLAMQAKLLRAIETRRVRPVGAPKETEVDVRIVCATNRTLAAMVNEGTFREDLYYRLAVVDVTLPPLRARREDISALAQHLHARMSGAKGALPAAFVEALAGRAWPGNVRELRNAIERAVTLGEIGELGGLSVAPGGAAPAASILPPGLASVVPLHLPLKDARLAWTSEFESIYIRAMLEKTSYNMTRAAELAGVSRRFLQRTVARLGLRIDGEELD
jgi:transcriptional regulator with PAS, ATPase and Fis domain